MRPSIPAMIALSLAAALPAGAAEFIPGWKLESIWSSNVFRTLDEDQFGRKIPKEDDFSLRTGPDLKLREMQGDFTYDLGYQLRYEEFARLRGIGEFDHFVNARADWHATDRTTFSVSDGFSDAASLNGLFEFNPLTAQAIVRADRQRVTTNTASSSVRHRLGPLWELSFSLDHDLYDYEAQNGSDSSSYSGNFQLTRGVTPRLVAGFGGTVQRQAFQTGFHGQEEGTNFVQAFGLVNYQFSRTLRLSASAGPALSIPDKTNVKESEVFDFQPFDINTCPADADGTRLIPLAQAERFLIRGESCQRLGVRLESLTHPPSPTIPPAPAGTIFLADERRETLRVTVPFVGDTGVKNSLTYFARLQLEKQWLAWRGSLSYSREASSGSGLGTSTLVDSLVGQLTWTPTQAWTVTLQGIGSLQSSVSATNAQFVAVRAGPHPVTLSGVGDFADSDGKPFQILYTTTENLTVPVPFEVRTGGKIDNPIDVRTYRVELRADRRITKNLTANSSASWYQQTSSGQRQDLVRSEYRFLLGLTWNFDGIPL